MGRGLDHHANQRFRAARAEQHSAVAGKGLFLPSDRREHGRIILGRRLVPHRDIHEALRVYGDFARELREREFGLHQHFHEF